MNQSASGGRPAPALRAVLAPLALAQFICSFAGSNMNVMITDMSEDLNTTVQGIQIAITIFLLVMAALMIPGGKLTDKYGRKRLFMIGLIVYAVGAVLSAFSPNLGVLILGNSILEGVGTALLIPPVYILTTLLFTELTSRARAFGVISALGGIGAAAGPLIGGLITSAISWRAAFIFQALIIGVIVLLSRKLTDPLPPDPARTFDISGAVLSAVGLVLVVMGILAADNSLWLMIILIIVGALVLALFFRSIRAKEKAGKEPLLDEPLSQSHIQPRPGDPKHSVGDAPRHLVCGLGLSAGGSRLQRHSDRCDLHRRDCRVAGLLTCRRASGEAAFAANAHPCRIHSHHRRCCSLAGIGGRYPNRLGICTGPAPHWSRTWRDAYAVGQRRAVELPGESARRDLRSVPQRVQPGLQPGHGDRRHHPRGGYHCNARARIRPRHECSSRRWCDRTGCCGHVAGEDSHRRCTGRSAAEILSGNHPRRVKCGTRVTGMVVAFTDSWIEV